VTGRTARGEESAVKVRIDAEACTGHGRCYTLAPEIFGSDDFGYGSVISEDVPAELHEQALIGLLNCPEQAVSIVQE
jgi:ferredoxin